METMDMTVKIKEESNKAVQELTEEIAQNRTIIKACEDIEKAIKQDESIRKIEANANLLKTVSQFSDVLKSDIAEKAKAEVQSSSVSVMASKKDLENIISRLNSVNNVNLNNNKMSLISKAQESIDNCEKWISFANDCLKGDYKAADEIIANKDTETKEVSNIAVEPVKNDEIPLEPVLDDDKEDNLEKKAEPILDTENEAKPLEPVLFDEFQPMDVLSPINTDDAAMQLNNLPSELNEEDKVVASEPVEPNDLKNVNDNLDDLISEMNKDIDAAKDPVENNIASLQSQQEEPFDFNSFEPDATIETNSSAQLNSAESVDKGAVKVDKIEEIGAPEDALNNIENKGESLALRAV